MSLAAAARRIAERTAHEQGLPERVEDPSAASKLAVLLDVPADQQPARRGRAA